MKPLHFFVTRFRTEYIEGESDEKGAGGLSERRSTSETKAEEDLQAGSCVENEDSLGPQVAYTLGCGNKMLTSYIPAAGTDSTTGLCVVCWPA